MLRRTSLSLICVLLLSSCQEPGADRVPLDLHVGGRTVVDLENPLRHSYNWPGVYFEARFAGPTVTVEVDDGENLLRLLIDGEVKLTLPRAGRRTITLEDLGDGEHTVRLEKLTETQGPTAAFLGFFVPDAASALPAPEYDHLIEFIGDSNTVGYGNTSTGRECTRQQVSDTTNTSLAFAPRVAGHFNADYRIIASSGHGVVRNYAGNSPGKTIPLLYGRALHDDPESTVRGERSPDVIVIRLGSNDFSTPLGDKEAWEDIDALRADFREAYVAFVERLEAQRAPQGYVLYSDADFAAEIEKIRETLAGNGIDRITVTSFPELDRLGCNYHLSVNDHALAAASLIDVLTRADLLTD